MILTEFFIIFGSLISITFGANIPYDIDDNVHFDYYDDDDTNARFEPQFYIWPQQFYGSNGHQQHFGNPLGFLESIIPGILQPQTTTTSKPNPAQQDCLDSCILRPPSHYDPVCGSNNETYHNEQRLECAQDCGINVTIAKRGTCQPMVSSIVSGIPPA